MNMKKKILSLTLAVAMCTSMGASVMADSVYKPINGGTVELTNSTPQLRTTVTVDSGNGEWSYGTGFSWGKKSVYSNLNHNTKVHRSSCSIDIFSDDSGWIPKRQTSRSETKGPLDSTAYTNWDVQ